MANAGNPEPLVEMEPPVAASVTDWSGLYIGGFYSFGTSEIYIIETGSIASGQNYNGVGSETTFSA